jgi:ATP adenylyltransferase
MDYIRAATDDEPGDAQVCIFCALPGRRDDTAAHILARDERAFVVLNAYPYNPGHLMVAPLRHVGDFEALTTEEHASLSAFLASAVRVLREEMSPHGFNLGMNVGRVAGAGFPGHLHWHVVPRWSGDTNFMPVTGATRVLPELVEDTDRRLRPRFESTPRA